MSERKKIVKTVAKTIAAHDAEFGLNQGWEHLAKFARDDYKETANRVLVALADHFEGWDVADSEEASEDSYFLNDHLLELLRG